MRRLAVVFAVATVVAMAASAAFAQGDQQIQLNNRNSDPKWSTYTPKPDGTLWNSPTATTGGALWLNNGSSVALLPATQDINLELWAQAPAPYGWTRLVTDLLESRPTARQPVPATGISAALITTSRKGLTSRACSMMSTALYPKYREPTTSAVRVPTSMWSCTRGWGPMTVSLRPSPPGRLSAIAVCSTSTFRMPTTPGPFRIGLPSGHDLEGGVARRRQYGRQGGHQRPDHRAGELRSEQRDGLVDRRFQQRRQSGHQRPDHRAGELWSQRWRGHRAWPPCQSRRACCCWPQPCWPCSYAQRKRK